MWRAILVVLVVGGRLIDKMRFWWWACANYSEAAAAVAVATKRTGRRRTVFPTCFFFCPRISANKRGGRVEFSEPKDFKVGTVAAVAAASAVEVFGFFILLVAVIMYLSFFSSIFPIVVEFSRASFQRIVEPGPLSLLRPARRAHERCTPHATISKKSGGGGGSD